MRRRERVSGWAVAGLAVVGLATAAIGVSLSPVFAAEQIFVHGVEHLRPSEVRRITGLSVGTNVLHVDLAAALARLERNPWVAEATARRELPAVIVIDVRERRPVGRMTTSAGRALLMEDGSVIEGATRRGLPVIAVPATSAGSGTAAGIARALRALPQPVIEEVTLAWMEPTGTLRLELHRRIRVIYGPVVEPRAKGIAIQELLAWADPLDVRVLAFDVSVPSAPTARLAGGMIVP